MKKTLKKIIIFGIVLTLIGFAGNLFVDNPYMHRLLGLAINKQVTQYTNLTLDFKAIKVSVVPPSIDLYGVSIATVVAPESPLLTVSQARARLSIWSLVLGKVRLAYLEFNDPTLLWPPPWNFPGLLRTPPEPSKESSSRMAWPPPFELPVDRVYLKNAKAFAEVPLFSVPEAASYLSTGFSSLDATFTYHSWRDLRLDVDIKGLDLSLGSMSMLEDTSLVTSLQLNDHHLKIESLRVDGERVHAEGKGGGDLFDTQGPQATLKSLSFALKTKANADISILGSFLEIGDTHGILDGDCKIVATIPLSPEAGSATFNISGTGTSHDARLFGMRLFNSTSTYEVTPKGLRLPAIDVIVGDTRVGKGQGEIKFNEAIDIDFTASANGLHLVDLLEGLNVDSRLLDVAIDSPNIHISGKGSPFMLDVTAAARASALEIPAAGDDHRNFPASPVCQTELRLAVTAEQLDLAGTHGTCFLPETIGPKKDKQERVASDVAVGGKIVFSGTSGIDIKVALPAANLQLAQYVAQVPMQGTGRVETRITGPFDHIRVTTHFDQDDVTIMRIPLGHVRGEVTYLDQVVSWRNIEAEGDDAGTIVAAVGSIDFDKAEMPLTTTFDAKNLSREVTRAIASVFVADADFGVDVKSLQGHFSAPLFYPLAGTGDFSFALSEARLDGETLLTSAEGRLVNSAKTPGWSSENLLLTLDTLAIAAELKHRRAAPFDLAKAEAAKALPQKLGLGALDHVDVKFRTLATHGPLPNAAGDASEARDQLGHIPFAGEPLRKIDLKGRIETQGEVSGTVSELQGTFTATLTDIQLLGNPMAAVNVRGFLRGGHLDLMVDHAGNALEGRFSLELLQDGLPYEWFFSCHRLDLRVLGTEYFHTDPRNYIYFTGDWRLRGQLTDWWHSQGELSINDLRANYVHALGTQTKTLQLRQDHPVKLLFAKDGWRFEGDRELYLSGRHLQLHLATAQSHPPERLGLTFDSIIDAAIVRDFVQDVDTAEGKVRLFGSMFGSATDPKPSIELTDLPSAPLIASTWKPVALGFADIRPAFRNIGLKVVYHDGRLYIEKLTADKGTGKLSALGAIDIGASGGDESHLEVSLNDATVVYPVAFLKNFETQVSGNLVVSGRGFPYKIAGDITVNKARSTREVDIRDEIINALRQKSFSTTIVSEKPRVLFDLNVNANHTINIHNRNLQTQLSADLHIKGSDIAPSISGQVEVDKGKFTYKQEFKVTRGLVIFDDPVKPDPNLDIVAVSEVDVYRVYLTITGRASNPTVEFAVDPPTREGGNAITKLEILVLLSRGKLPEEGQQGQQTQNAATSEAANLLLGQFEEPIEKLLDASGQSVVRNVYIDTHPAPDGSPVPRLNLPIDLGENVDLVLRTDQDTSEVSLEYNLNESIYLSGIHEIPHSKDQQPTQTTPGEIEGDSKVNLKFRFSFD